MEPTLYYLGAMLRLPVHAIPGHGYAVRMGCSRAITVLGASSRDACVNLLIVAAALGLGAQA